MARAPNVVVAADVPPRRVVLDQFIFIFLFIAFPPIQKWELLRRLNLFDRMFLSEGGHFYVDMHFYATFFLPVKVKNCYFYVSMHFSAIFFYLRGPQRRKKKQHFCVNCYSIQ